MWKRLSQKARLAIWFITACVIFLALLLLMYGLFSLFTAQSREGEGVTFTYGIGSRRDSSVEGEKNVYMPNGVPYANFTLLSKAYPFSQSGDEDEIRYLIEVDDDVYDTVTFYYDSRKAVVNGMHITLSSPVKRCTSGVMVPCEFVENYMDGISLEITEEKIRVSYEEGKVSLKPSLHPISPIEPNS